jgi:hypothetical protein
MRHSSATELPLNGILTAEGGLESSAKVRRH